MSTAEKGGGLFSGGYGTWIARTKVLQKITMNIVMYIACGSPYTRRLW